MTKTKPIHSPPPPRGLSPWQVQRLRIVLRRSACSETWVDDQLITRSEIDGDGDFICHTFFDPRVFPPGGRRGTTMRWCRGCGRYSPAPAISLIEHRESRLGPVVWATLMCDDCRIADDFEAHQELYEAGLHLRPVGSQSFVMRAYLHSDRARKI